MNLGAQPCDPGFQKLHKTLKVVLEVGDSSPLGLLRNGSRTRIGGGPTVLHPQVASCGPDDWNGGEWQVSRLHLDVSMVRQPGVWILQGVVQDLFQRGARCCSRGLGLKENQMVTSGHFSAWSESGGRGLHVSSSGQHA